MNIHQQRAHFNKFVMKMADTMLAKGDDYAGNDCRLSNFKLAGAITGVGARMNCLNMIATKVARLGVLFNAEKPPSNESIRDSILDLANYAVLLDQILEDED